MWFKAKVVETTGNVLVGLLSDCIECGVWMKRAIRLLCVIIVVHLFVYSFLRTVWLHAQTAGLVCVWIR